MSEFGEYADKAKDFAGEHSDQAQEGIERGSKFADEKTGGRFSEQIDQGSQQAGEYVQGLGGGEGEGGQTESQQEGGQQGGGQQSEG